LSIIEKNNGLKLFTTIVGSHMWGMERSDSDIDYATIYVANSKDILLNKQIRGKQIQNDKVDETYYELGHFISNLLKGNVNFLWAVMSPLVENEYKTSLRELREITSINIAKNCFYSINGLAKHNIYHFITGTKKWTSKNREIDRESLLYKKKLNVIGRTLKFGINLLTWEKCLFEKVNIETEDELWELKNQLTEAYKNSMLKEEPDKKSFETYVIKWRLHKMKKEGLI